MLRDLKHSLLSCLDKVPNKIKDCGCNIIKSNHHRGLRANGNVASAYIMSYSVLCLQSCLQVDMGCAHLQPAVAHQQLHQPHGA